MIQGKKSLIIALLVIPLISVGSFLTWNIQKTQAVTKPPEFTGTTKFEFIDKTSIKANNGVVFKLAQQDPYRGIFNGRTLKDPDSIFGAYKRAYVSTDEYNYDNITAKYVLSYADDDWFYVYKIKYFSPPSSIGMAICDTPHLDRFCPEYYYWSSFYELSKDQVKDLKESYEKATKGRKLKPKELLTGDYKLAGEIIPLGSWETPPEKILNNSDNTIWLQDSAGNDIKTNAFIKKEGDKYYYEIGFQEMTNKGLYIDSIYQLKLLNTDGYNINLKNYTWSATTSFKIFKDGNEYKIKNLNRNRGGGKEIIKLTDIKKTDGINLTVRETIGSFLTEALNSAINWCAYFINLTVEYFSGWIQAALQNANLENIDKAWHKIRNITITLLMLGLIIIAFANVLSIDIEQYGAQRLIPKMVLNVVLTYFSFLIVKVLLEVANVLSTEFQNLLGGLGGSADLMKNFMNKGRVLDVSGMDVVGSIGAIILMIIVWIGVILTMVYLSLVLLARIVMIKFLTVVAPVALILGIMPFTESLLKRWWSELFKWIFMGPAVMGVLLIGSIIMENAGVGSVSSQAIPNTDALSGFQSVFYILTAAVVYFFAATIPKSMGGEIMAMWGKIARKGAKHIPGAKTAQQIWEQRKKDTDRKIANRASRLRAGISRIPVVGRLAGYPSKIEQETAYSRMQDAIVSEKADLIKNLSKDELNNKFMELHNKRFKRKGDLHEMHAITRVLAERGQLESDGEKNEALFKAQQEAISQFAPMDNTIFKSVLKENTAAALQNEKLRPTALSSIKNKELRDLKGSAFKALAKVAPDRVREYTYDHVKRALEQGAPGLIEEIKNNRNLFNSDAQRAFGEKKEKGIIIVQGQVTKDDLDYYRKGGKEE